MTINYTQPPLGITPESLFKEQRIRDLSRAIYNYIQGGFIQYKYLPFLISWCDELKRRLEELEQGRQSKIS